MNNYWMLLYDPCNIEQEYVLFVIVIIKSVSSYLEDTLKVYFFVPRGLRALKFPN